MRVDSVILLCLTLGCATAPLPPTCPPQEESVPEEPEARAAEVPPPRCGNGVVDEGELCDPHVRWAERCPEPWGVCWVCSPACNAFVSERSDVDGTRPFCERVYGRSTASRTYDAYGRLTVDVTDYGPQNRVIEWRYKYDERGRLVRTDSDSRGEHPLRERMIHVYEEALCVRSWSDNDLDGEPERVFEFTYFDDGRMQRMTCLDATSDGAVCADTRYTYDREGQWTSRVATYPDEEHHNTHTRQFDVWGRQTYDAYGNTPEGSGPLAETRTVFIEGGSLVLFRTADGTLVRSRLDERGNKVEGTYTGADGMSNTGVSEHSYNEQGLLIGTRMLAPGESAPELTGLYSYEYDERHNRIAYSSHRGDERTVIASWGYECLDEVFERMPRREFTERSVTSVE